MLWAFAVTSLALVMVTLDNLVVTTALPVIREDLHASLEGLEWTVNAYTLTFAVLLLTGAALAPSMGVLVAAISSARGSSHACTSRRGLRLRPAAGQRRVWKEAAERLPYPAEESVDCGRERRQPETFQKPTQPASRGEVLEHADRCWTVHHPHPARLDELPRLADLLLGNTRGIESGRLVVPSSKRRGPETRACDHDVVRSRWVDVIRCSSSGFAACCSPACRSAPDAPRRCRRSRLLLAAAPDESSTRSCRAGQRPFRRGRRRR
jgi:hypothetical protein